MKKYLSLIVLLFVVVSAGWSIYASGNTSADSPQQMIVNQIIAREKASVEAWQRKDKAFWADYLTDDATFFGSESPYLEVDPKVNFLPKFDQYADQFKILDAQMYNPRVQVYGDVAILTYNNSVTTNFGGQVMNYTGKVSSVYVKQGGTWRVVHVHESQNPKAR